MAKTVSDAIEIMRITLGRRNQKDIDSNIDKFIGYLSDFLNLEMPNDVKLFEQFGTLTFQIGTGAVDGVYDFNDLPSANFSFSNISLEGFITPTSTGTSSVSWNPLNIYQDPTKFYNKWGVSNVSILTKGYPTDMLYYGDELVFRTLPDVSYNVILYGYKRSATVSEENESLPFDWWLRYAVYGAAFNYATDYRYDAKDLGRIEKAFSKERKLLLTNTHNQVKLKPGERSF